MLRRVRNVVDVSLDCDWRAVVSTGFGRADG